VLIYTAARVGAVAKLTLKTFQHDGTQYALRFSEKGGKSREIPVRQDLERLPLAYIVVAGIAEGPLLAVRGWLRALRRRSQRHRLTWARSGRHVDRWLPTPRSCTRVRTSGSTPVTRSKSRMRQFRTYGSARGAVRKGGPYRDQLNRLAPAACGLRWCRRLHRLKAA
jgi:hypothetical protein